MRPTIVDYNEKRYFFKYIFAHQNCHQNTRQATAGWAIQELFSSTIMIKDRITAFGCCQKPFLLVTPFVPCSIILLLQLNPLFLQLNRSKLQLSAHFLQLNTQNLQLNVKHQKYPLN